MCDTCFIGYFVSNGWVIRFFIFQYACYITLQKYKCMFWHVLKVAQENKWYHWISELKLHLIDTFLLLLVAFKTWPFLTWPWPDLQFSLLKMSSDNQMDTIIELCGQNRPENLCHMTYILLQNFRDLLWPSFDLKCTLSMLDNSIIRSIWI